MGALLRFLIATAVLPVVALANRTSCFAYIDCYERAQVQLKDCVGGTALALTVEAKDRTAAELVRGRGAVFNQCQDRLARELVDFDTLQVITMEDARECFEKLPGSGKRVAFNVATCVPYNSQPQRDNYGKETAQCVIDYYNDRQKCEQLLDCCPDHTRCGERMNAVSVAYQHAKAKGLQIVSNMLKCVSSTDPSASGIISSLHYQRSTLRNAGLPFFRPDTATEERITRRLSLTSNAAIEQRKQRFTRRYHQIRSLLAQRIHKVSVETSRSTPAATNNLPSERRIAIVKNLLRNADDQEMATYMSLIADGEFDKLSALEKQKLRKAESDAQVDEASQKMGKIRDAIKAALATKDQKTLNFLETSGSTADRLAMIALRQKGDEDWDAELSSIIDKDANTEIDSETLFRAKKFANALEGVLQAQKELILSSKDSFTGNGLPTTRTSSKAPPHDERQAHDFNTLTHNLRKGVAIVSADTDPVTTTVGTTTTVVEETTTAKAKSETTTQIPTEITTEATTATTTTEEATTTTEEVTTERNTPLPQAVMDMPAQPLSQSKMISIVQPVDGAVEMIKTTPDEARPTNEILEQLEAEVKKGQKEEKPEAEGQIRGEDKRAVEEPIAEGATEEKGEPTDLKALSALLKEEAVTEKTTVATTEVTTTEAITETTTEAATTTLEVTTEAPTEATTTVLPTTKIPLNEKSKNLMKKVVRDMKKRIERLRNKVETTTEKAPATISPEDRPSLEVEPLTESVEGSGMEPTTAIPEKSVVEKKEKKNKKEKVVRDQGVNHCVALANCEDLVRDYQEQCDRRFSPEIISHGIEETEIVEALKNATVSHNDIVLRACLRPLDKAAYANLKQLLVIQRGVRRACLELGRNRPVLSEDQSAVCHSPLPSTEPLDDFLSQTHFRSQETHTLCLAKLAPLRETCQTIGSCCASATACENYIAASPVKQLKDEATAVLVQRQHVCEERMLETLKYIQKRLSTRRRRV